MRHVHHRGAPGRLPAVLALSLAATLACAGCFSTPAAKKDPCSGQTCSGEGTCAVQSGAPVCQCKSGYHAEGLTCIANGTTGPCNGITCSGHGTCTASNGTATCQCATGYHAVGTTCVQNGTDPCAGVTCSGHGTCSSSNGTATCQCDPGYQAQGLTCTQTCAAWTGNLVVKSVGTTAKVTLAGGAFGYGGELVLKAGSDKVSVAFDKNGALNNPGGGASIPVIPGTYEAYYQTANGNTVVDPVNDMHLLGTEDLTSSRQVTLDVPVVQVTSHVTLGGGAFAYGGELFLEPASGSESVSLQVARDGALVNPGGGSAVPLIPGTYEVYYGSVNGDTITDPVNTHHLLGSVDLTQTQQITFDIPVVHVTSHITLAGGAFAGGGELLLEDDGGDSVSLEFDKNGALKNPGGGSTVPVIAGTYKVYYQTANVDRVTDPINEKHLLGTVDLTKTQKIAFDVPVKQVTSHITLAGGAFAYGGELLLEDGNGDSVPLQFDKNGKLLTSGGNGATPLIPATYEVYYETANGDTVTDPMNTRHLLGSVDLTKTQQIAFDVPVTQVSSHMTLAGGAFAYGGELVLEDATGTDRISMQFDQNGAFANTGGATSIPVIPGSYEVYYQTANGDTVTDPMNTMYHLGTVDLTTTSQIAFDLKPVSVLAHVTLGGGLFTYGGELTFEDPSGTDSLGAQFDQNGALMNPGGGSEIPVLPGHYEVYYVTANGDTTTDPMNTKHLLGCFDVQ